MNGVNPSSYPVVQSPYGTHLNISKDLQKVPAGSVNTDSFVRFDSNFSYITMEDALRGDFSAVKSPMDAPINAFMDGTLCPKPNCRPSMNAC